jgi:hypothetical protein
MTQRMPYLGPDYFRVLDDEQVAVFRTAGVDPEQGMAVTAMSMSDEENEPGHIAMLIAALINRLAMADPTVLPFADGLRVTNTLGSGGVICGRTHCTLSTANNCCLRDIDSAPMSTGR